MRVTAKKQKEKAKRVARAFERPRSQSQACFCGSRRGVHYEPRIGRDLCVRHAIAHVG